MAIFRIDIQGKSEERELIAFLDKHYYKYEIEVNDELDGTKLQEILNRKADFISCKTAALPWSEIKKKYEGA